MADHYYLVVIICAALAGGWALAIYVSRNNKALADKLSAIHEALAVHKAEHATTELRLQTLTGRVDEHDKTLKEHAEILASAAFSSTMLELARAVRQLMPKSEE